MQSFCMHIIQTHKKAVQVAGNLIVDIALNKLSTNTSATLTLTQEALVN